MAHMLYQIHISFDAETLDANPLCKQGRLSNKIVIVNETVYKHKRFGRLLPI